MAPEDSDWERLADYVTRRRTQLGMTQAAVQAAGGPSVATMRLIEGAMQRSYRGVILGRLEEVLRWVTGSVDAILAGGEPTEAERGAPASRPPKLDPELLRIVMLMADPDVPPKEKDFLREQLRRWADYVEQEKNTAPTTPRDALGQRRAAGN